MNSAYTFFVFVLRLKNSPFWPHFLKLKSSGPSTLLRRTNGPHPMKRTSAIGANSRLSINTWQLLPLVQERNLPLFPAITITSSLSCDGKNCFLCPITPFATLMVLHSLAFTIAAMIPPRVRCTAITFTPDPSFFSHFIWSLSHLWQVLATSSFELSLNSQQSTSTASIDQPHEAQIFDSKVERVDPASFTCRKRIAAAEEYPKSQAIRAQWSVKERVSFLWQLPLRPTEFLSPSYSKRTRKHGCKCIAAQINSPDCLEESN